jgi:hypothetical protein
MSLHALELIQLLTLHPAPRAAVLAASISPHRSGMAVLLHAAGTGHAGPPFYGLADPEVRRQAAGGSLSHKLRLRRRRPARRPVRRPWLAPRTRGGQPQSGRRGRSARALLRAAAAGPWRGRQISASLAACPMVVVGRLRF